MRLQELDGHDGKQQVDDEEVAKYRHEEVEHHRVVARRGLLVNHDLRPPLQRNRLENLRVTKGTGTFVSAYADYYTLHNPHSLQ